MLEQLSAYPNLSRVVAEVLSIWPEHDSYVEARFAGDPPDFLQRADEFAELAVRNMGDDIRLYCQDYRWMCEQFLEEDLFFVRHGRYRLQSFAEAYEQVYSRPEYMARYVRGILISQIIWRPHAVAFDLFRTEFLPGIPSGGDYLEVGPGHGFFLYFAAQQPLGKIEAWDVSASSITETRSALSRLGVTRDITIVGQDVLVAPTRNDEFDAAVISEVLEHLEQPGAALKSLRSALRPGGRIFINAPINSPAPDHIYLWRDPDEFTSFVEEQGFEIESRHFLPVTGHTLDRALRRKLSVSCIVIGKKVD